MDNLQFNQIINETKNDKSFPLKYLIKLFNYHNDNLILPVKCTNPLTAIKCFVPLPSRLLLSELYSGDDKIIKNNNEYQFHGKPGNRVIFADKILPFNYDSKLNTNLENVENSDDNDCSLSNIQKNISPIPFSFPLYNDLDEIEILQSNVYYYELTIESTQNIENNGWYNECISIGFANKNIPFDSHIGWFAGSVGFHSDDGTVRINNSGPEAPCVSDTWKVGDTIGAGIIYQSNYLIKPFFTLNGKIVFQSDQYIYITMPIFPAIGYDHGNSIKLNFSNDKFEFKLKKFIQANSDIIISTKNSFIENYDIGNYLNDLPNKKILNNKTTIPSFSNNPTNLTNLIYQDNPTDIFNNNMSTINDETNILPISALAPSITLPSLPPLSLQMQMEMEIPEQISNTSPWSNSIIEEWSLPNLNQTNQTNQTTIYDPLQFWLNHNNNLPIVGLSYLNSSIPTQQLASISMTIPPSDIDNELLTVEPTPPAPISGTGPGHQTPPSDNASDNDTQ